MLTARAQDGDVLAMAVRFDLYLTKPFNPMELIAFVKRIFSMENAQPMKSDTQSEASPG